MANENNLASQIKNAFPPVSEKPAASSGANDRVASFARDMAPIAERVSAETGVDPAVLIGHWGLETGWGKSVIPGTNNFGNIKDFRGSGVTARDNMNGSVDKYRAYESPEDFAGNFTQLLKTGRYKGALSALDAQSYFSALKAGGYAEDPNYVRSGVKAADMVKRVMGEGRPAASIYPERGEYIGQTEKVQERTRRQEAADESPLSTSLGRGFEGLKHNVKQFASNLAGDSDAVAERIRAKREWDEANPAPSSSEKFTRQWQSLAEDDYSGMLGAALSNPGGMLNQMVEQTPNSLPGLALQIPTAIASGALLATGWGAPIAIGLQGLAAFAGNVMPEGGAIIEERLAKSGVNPNDTAAVAKWIADNRSANIEGGVKKAGVISLVDGATGYLGAKMIAGPAVRYAKAEQAALANAGINLSDKAAVAAARATPAYKQAVAVPAKELLDATTRAQKTVRELGGVGLETAGEGVGEYAGSYAANGEASVKDAVLESLMGAGNSAAMTGANMATAAMRKPEIDRAALGALAATPVQPVIKQNSPLSNMASVGQAAQANAAQSDPAAARMNELYAKAQGGEFLSPEELQEFRTLQAQSNGAAPSGWEAPNQVNMMHPDPMEKRVQAVSPFAEDKAFLSALRADPRYGKESVTELLAAWAKARNPALSRDIRENALDALEGFTSSFVGPNTLNPKGQTVNLGGSVDPGQSVAPYQQQGGAVGPTIRRPDGRTLDGEIITRPEGMAGANPNQLKAPPVLGLPTEEALQAKRQADADYEQAYQDLVKAEQLGANEAEIADYQRAMLEAERLRDELAAQLADSDARVADSQQREAEARRRDILGNVIEQGISGVNPVADVANRFSAELMRQGYRDTAPTDAETQSILRAVDVANAREDGPLPSLPNEGDFYAPPKAQRTAPPKAESKPKQQPNRRLTPKEIREYVAAGAILNGDTLTLPDGTVLKLKGPQIAAAREAMRKVAPAQVETAPDKANESGALPQPDAPQQVESPAAVSEKPAESLDVSTEPAPYFVLAPGGRDKNGLLARNEMPALSLEDARDKAMAFVRKAGLTQDSFGAGIQVFDANTGQPAARINYSGDIVPTESIEQARARSGVAADVSTRTDDQLRYLANNGKPGWKEAAQAEMARREGAKPAPASDLAGEKIDSEWTAFAPETGTLGIPRDDMPQIKAEHRGAMTNFMNARGVDHRAEEVPADSLRPTQAEFSPEKVKKAMEFDGGDRSILVSNDDYVLDGHHQWLAKRESGDEIKVIRLDAPISELVPLALEFPSSTTAGDEKPEAPATEASDTATAQPDPREAYADQKERAYVAKRGGVVPPKAAMAVRIGAYREYDRNQAAQDKQSEWVSLDEYVKSNPNVRETRARNAWASDISDAITEGKDIPPTIVDELLEKMPGFAPDAIASRDVLMDRYKQAIDTDIERAIERLREEHANLAKKLDHKRVKTSHEKYVEVRDQLISLNDRIHALEQERRDRARGDFTTETAAEDYLVRRLVQLSGVSEEGAKTRIVRATVSAQPTHQDPGQPSEPVTPAVVAKSIQKSARNTEFNPAEAKKWLIGEIDKAVANVAAENAELAAELVREKVKTFDMQAAERKYGKGSKAASSARDSFNALRDSNVAKIAKQIGFVTFDVPGDGKFKVMNTVDGLNAFRSKVEKSPGFARPTAPRSGRSMPGGPSLDESIADAKKNGGSVLSEIGNAIEIARLRGKEDDTLLDRFKENSGGKSYDEWRAEQEAAEEIAAREEAERSQTPSEKEADNAKRETRSEVGQPSDLTNIFAGLSSRGLAKTRAQKAAQAHPRAEQIAYVQDNFLDILTELEDSGIVNINCD